MQQEFKKESLVLPLMRVGRRQGDLKRGSDFWPKRWVGVCQSREVCILGTEGKGSEICKHVVCGKTCGIALCGEWVAVWGAADNRDKAGDPLPKCEGPWMSWLGVWTSSRGHCGPKRERGRDIGRERSRLPTRSPMWDSILGFQDHALSQRPLLNHWATQASPKKVLNQEVVYSELP